MPEWICPQCDNGDISDAGGYLLCAGCNFAFPAHNGNEVAARIAFNHNEKYYRAPKRRRVGRPNKGDTAPPRKETA